MAQDAARTIAVGLAVTADEDFRTASLPLFEAGMVDALSWSFEATSGRAAPEWLELLVEFYAAEGRLTFHGLALSPLSARPDPGRRAQWLTRAGDAARRYRLTHASEHFGFCAAGDFVFGAPLPMPWSQAALTAGRASLHALATATGCAPGLENLALALHPSDARSHGAYLDALVRERADAFLVLDLHNLICQASTFELDVETLVATYPLERVRELHVAGGRMVQALPGTKPVRRDTHDRALSADVLALVPHVLARAPHVQCVFLERLPGTLGAAIEREQLARDFEQLTELVHKAPKPHRSAPTRSEYVDVLDKLIDDDAEQLHALQHALLEALWQAPDVESARKSLLQQPKLAPYYAWIDRAEPRMLETSRELVKRWSVRATEHVPQDGAG